MIAGTDGEVFREVPLSPYYWWPFVVALMAVVAFGLVGLKRGYSWHASAIGAGAAALVTATIASGLANAVAVPFTGAVNARNQLIAFAVVVVVFVIIGILFTLLSNSRVSSGVGGAGDRQK